MQCEWDDCDQVINDNITAHINTHIESQTTYACLWKGCKRYNEKQSNKYTLQAHVRKHTNERPYQCNKCSKQYTRSDALNKHIKNHQKVQEETDDLTTQLSILHLRKEIAKINLEVQGQRRTRLMHDIQIANHKLYDNVYTRINGGGKRVLQEMKPSWDKYINRKKE